MISINRAKDRYYEVTKPDRLLMEEHERRLGRYLLNAIENGEEYVLYEVPWLLNGPYPVFCADEITVELIRVSREQGYTVNLVQRNPNVIEVSGWAENRHRARHPAPKKVKQVKQVKQSKQVNEIKVTPNDAKRGVLSARLKQKLVRLK